MTDTSKFKEIYVVGRPRSGTVWLNRLLADALNSPMEAKGDAFIEPPIYHGPGRGGGYVIRKAHGAEKLAPTVFIQRDPRDVAVSTMMFRKQNKVFPSVKQMCEPHSLSYEYHIRMWLDYEKEGKAEYYTRYEWLQQNPAQHLRDIVFTMTSKPIAIEHLNNVIRRQSFKVVKKNDKEGRYDSSMYKGVSGEWRKFFTPEIGDYMHNKMGNFMIEQGYVKDKTWYEELDESKRT